MTSFYYYGILYIVKERKTKKKTKKLSQINKKVLTKYYTNGIIYIESEVDTMTPTQRNKSRAIAEANQKARKDERLGLKKPNLKSKKKSK